MVWGPGPEVIKLSRVRTHTKNVVRAPNCTITQEVEVIKFKLFHTRIHTQLEYKSVISRVCSIAYLEPYSKLFLCEILLPTKSIGQNLTNYLRVQIFFVCTLLLFGENKRGGGVTMYTYLHVYKLYKLYTQCTPVYSTHIYAVRDNS